MTIPKMCSFCLTEKPAVFVSPNTPATVCPDCIKAMDKGVYASPTVDEGDLHGA
jgi:recombinational DNA repair protein (RecF pathway)